MSGGKETPRQKMIGMMYLVLTALLALNVSKDILNAFIIVDESLTQTNETVAMKSQSLYSDFAKAMAENAAKTKPYKDKADKAKKLTEDMVAYVKNLRAELIMAVEKVDKKVADTLQIGGINGKDNYDIPTLLMIGADQVNGKGAKGEALKLKLEEYKKAMIALLDPKDQKAVGNLGFDLEDKTNIHSEGKKMSWQMNNFFHTILAADVVLFNQIELQLKNAEADVVNKLKEYIYGADMPFDQIQARVIAKSNYVMTGEEYQAQIFVAASSSSMTPQILIQEGIDSMDANAFNAKYAMSAKKLGGDPASVVNGVVQYKTPASSEGLKKFAGVINLKNPKTGTTTPYPFYSEYMVARPAAVVSADKMNVFYIGLDNPLSVSVPGVASENLSVNIQGGTIKKTGNGKFAVRVSAPGKVKVSVSAKLGNSSKQMGSFEYRVKKIPNPIPKIVGQSSGVMSKSKMLGLPQVQAVLEDFLFDGVKYTITSYKFSSVAKSGQILETECKGDNGRMNASAIGILNKVSSGQKVFFENIKAVGPDGTTRPLPDMIFKIQ